MSYTFTNVPVYGFDVQGSRVQIAHLATKTVEDALPLGGRLYYTNPNGDGEYEFFKLDGSPVTESQIAAAFQNKDSALLSSIVAYKVKQAGTVDKYYVYHDQVFTSKRWTYYDPETIVEGDPRYNANWPGYAFESLGTSRDIGAGKTNTQKVMEKDGGVYVQANSNGYPTVWYKIKEMRDSKIGGCDDWFLPSDRELEELRKAIGFSRITTSDDPVILSAGAVTGGVIAGTADGQTHYRDYQTTRTCYPSANAFLSQYLWASSENSAVLSWSWNWSSQAWTNTSKYYTGSVVGVRAF